MKCHKYSEKEIEFFSNFVPGHSYKEIRAEFIKRFKWEISLSQVKGSVARYNLNTGRTGRFEKGHITWNKGMKGLNIGGKKSQFKKGHIPVNHRSVGSEVIDKNGYIKIKVAEPNKWEFKQRVVWEKEFGPINEGEVIIFLDNNKSNVDISNLAKINKREHIELNKRKLRFDNSELTATGINLVKLDIAIKENK